MFNMNNSTYTARLVELLESAIEDVEFGTGDGQFDKGLACGMIMYSGYWEDCGLMIARILCLFNDVIAYTKAKKEQKQ